MKFNRMVLALAWRSPGLRIRGARPRWSKACRCPLGSNAAASSSRCPPRMNSKNRTNTPPGNRLCAPGRRQPGQVGEKRRVVSRKLGQSQENRQTFLQAALDVARGAFRFTTDISSSSIRRAVDIRVATVTRPACRHRPVGKSSSDRDVVCLIEGHIQGSARRMRRWTWRRRCSSTSRRNRRRRADRSQPDPKVAASDAASRSGRPETEITAGQGAAKHGRQVESSGGGSADRKAP